MFKLDLSNSLDNILYYDYMNKKEQEQKKNDNEKQKNNVETEQTTITP